MCNTAIYKLYYGILFFSLSEHKANLTELHPKVRQTFIMQSKGQLPELGVARCLLVTDVGLTVGGSKS